MARLLEIATTRRAPCALPMFAKSTEVMVSHEEGRSIEPRSGPRGQLAAGIPSLTSQAGMTGRLSTQHLYEF